MINSNYSQFIQQKRRILGYIQKDIFKKTIVYEMSKIANVQSSHNACLDSPITLCMIEHVQTLHFLAALESKALSEWHGFS